MLNGPVLLVGESLGNKRAMNGHGPFFPLGAAEGLYTQLIIKQYLAFSLLFFLCVCLSQEPHEDMGLWFRAGSHHLPVH